MAMSNQARKQKVQTKKPIKRFDSIKLLRTIVFGPTIAVLFFATVYFAWWGMSKLFYILHVWVTGEFVPWISSNWPIIIGIWAAVAITSIIYFVCIEERKKPKSKQQSEVKNTSNTSKKNKANEEDFNSYMSEEEFEMNFPDLSI